MLKLATAVAVLLSCASPSLADVYVDGYYGSNNSSSSSDLLYGRSGNNCVFC